MDEVTRNERTTLNLIALVFALAFPTLVTLVYFKWLNDYATSVQQTAFSIGKTLQFAFPVVWVWLFFRYRFKRDHRQRNVELAAEKKSSESRIPNWLWAIGFGLDVCIIMGIAYWVLSGGDVLEEMKGKVGEKVAGLGMDSVWKFAMLSTFYALVHSFLEEYYWRWFVYDLLKRFVNVPMANLISGLGFMAHHVVLLSVYLGWTSPMTWLCSAGVAIGGMYWAWLYQRTGTLFWPWVSHMVVDAGIFVLGYFLIW